MDGGPCQNGPHGPANKAQVAPGEVSSIPHVVAVVVVLAVVVVVVLVVVVAVAVAVVVVVVAVVKAPVVGVHVM